ncbi:origin recognition complex subunit 2 [Rhinichthys klamathensis goyatoka]|uniref:origin recognition complex subunit 2 n=1 Tax=Rhinichthys klamathensis goyatoka TaxID=3034132 RepID=UPI0024B4A3DB|nr:origin recognition complex subunit 2 [Rhinichthys klamathensis goyatoka]
MTQKQPLEVRFVADEDVLDHIVEKQQDVKAADGSVQTLVTVKTPQKCRRSADEEEDEEELFKEQNYVEVLYAGSQDESENAVVAAGSSVFSFQTIKRGKKMAQMASELARTPGKSVSFSTSDTNDESTSKKSANQSKTPQKGKKVQFISTTPHRLRRRLTAPSLRSDSDSDLSPSNSDDDEDDDEEHEAQKPKTPSKHTAAALYKTPSKKSKKAEDLVEEYFEAHSSSKVLTSDRTLQKLHTPQLDRETLLRLLSENTPRYAEEIHQLNAKHEKNFDQWMMQMHMGFNIVIYGLGSKKLLLEKFCSSLLSDWDHVVVNGFFPSITLKAILNSITADVFQHEGSFRNPGDQVDFIARALREDPSNHVFLIVNNIDGPMLRGDRTQHALGQLAALPNMHLLASIDHINAPLIWDQAKMSMFNWLWYETTTYLPYAEETSYENSLLVHQTGALALSSLTHVLRSLTPNARGIFRLLAEFQLENKDNPAYTGLSFQDFYQRCRESFLVNSDITLRTQLTEFRDHKLIRTKKGADGVEYLLIPVDNGTLTDFLEKNDVE